ncbi:MAG: Aldose 1-epimerase [Anaerocolumna sp.]|nr:Aldose 1-epimerase [Anaerocolumna sp.]
MSNFTLSNNELTLEFKSLGAELSRITDTKTKKEYLWNADPTYWKRHSPVLFPIVGSLNNQAYSYNGKTYSMSQHGFARDMEFTLISQTDTEIWFRLSSSEDTLKLYPFQFILEIGYQLLGRKIEVMWKVMNNDTKTMYFSIGGHPAFMCPLDGNGIQSDYSISFDNTGKLNYLAINEKGLVVHTKEPKTLDTNIIDDKSYLPIDSHLFDDDALIIENSLCHQVSLVDKEKNPYITVTFDAPLFGLWSPAKKNAPFICIEPWYGRCDSSDFTGTLEEREWGNTLDEGNEFFASYSIEIA